MLRKCNTSTDNKSLAWLWDITVKFQVTIITRLSHVVEYRRINRQCLIDARNYKTKDVLSHISSYDIKNCFTVFFVQTAG